MSWCIGVEEGESGRVATLTGFDSDGLATFTLDMDSGSVLKLESKEAAARLCFYIGKLGLGYNIILFEE